MPEKAKKLLVCSECKGTRGRGFHKCKACHGHGAGIVMGKYFLYWGGIFGLDDVVVRKIKRVVDKVIDLSLLLLMVFGLSSLIYRLFIIGFSNVATYNFWLQPSKLQLLLFIALFGILYFAYRSTRLAHKFERPLALKFKEKASLVELFAWDGIKGYKHKDISNALSLSSNKAIEKAFILAKKYKSNVKIEHLFLAILDQPKAKIIFGRLGVPIKSIRDRVMRNIGEGGEKLNVIEDSALEVIFLAYNEAVKRKARKLEINLLLLECVKQNSFLQEVLYDLNIDNKKLENVVKWIEVADKLRDRWMQFRKASVFRPKGEVNRVMTSLQTPVLDRFSEDLTGLAKRGYIRFCINREKVFEKIFRVIEGGGKGAVLVGNPGVGKATILDGLAERMVSENVPKILQDKRLIRLSLSEVLGGATTEESGKNLMAAMRDAAGSGNIVLDISDLEFFASSGAENLASLLAEELSRFKMPVLATTTPEGFKQVLEGKALGKIFERIDVAEPDNDLAIQILESESSGIEYKNHVYFSYDAISSAVTLSSKYLHDSYLPENALEVIKETALYVSNNKGKNSIVTREDVAKIISDKSKIPVTAATEDERQKLLHLEEVIHKRIIGQAEAVDAVSRALRRARSGLHGGKRPIANFLFLGPTGVGKTELAKTISEAYFGSEGAMIRVDMSEYQDKASVERMIGGAGQRGYLTEAVRKAPFALILLDELEKAHKDILNLFLQVMEDGRLTDGRGKTIDFTNAILVATSNAGSSYISKEVDKGTAIEKIKEQLMREELGSYFRPEFINRFDGVIVFKPLDQASIIKIAGLLVQNVSKKLEPKGVELVVENPALNELAKLGFDPKFGARPLRRVITREIEDRVANLLLSGKLKRRDKVVIHSLDNIEIVEGRKF